jgi:hypothetical protein
MSRVGLERHAPQRFRFGRFVMTMPYTVIGAMLAIGVIYVVIPLLVGAYRTWHAPRLVACPHQGVAAEVTVKPWRAAATSLFRKPWLEVKSCTFWPECHGCDEGCRKSISSE